jgi:hypothetical protein
MSCGLKISGAICRPIRKRWCPLFQGLLKREVFVKHWDDEDDLLADPAILSDFFVKHSEHEVVLLSSVFDYLDRAAQRDWTRHDVFAIDINLERRADAGAIYPWTSRVSRSLRFTESRVLYLQPPDSQRCAGREHLFPDR